MGLKLGYKMPHLGLSLYHVHLIYIQPNTKSQGVKLVKIVHILQCETKRNKTKRRKERNQTKERKEKKREKNPFGFFNK